MSLWGQAIPVHRGWMFTQLYISQGTGKTCEQSLQATTTTKSETLQVQRRHTHKNVEEEKVSKESSTWCKASGFLWWWYNGKSTSRTDLHYRPNTNWSQWQLKLGHIPQLCYRKKNWSDRESPGIASLAARAGVSSPLYSPLPVRDCCLVTRASLSKGESPPNSWFFIRNGFQGGDSLLLWNGEFMRTSTYVKPTLYFLLVVNSCVMQMWFSIVYKLLCLSSCIWNIY